MLSRTKRRRRLESVQNWLQKARPDLMEQNVSSGHWLPTFSLLIAVEQLLQYCQQLEEEIKELKR